MSFGLKLWIKSLNNFLGIMSKSLDYGVWHFKDSNISLTRFSDGDWAGNADDRKSTSRGFFYLGINLVSWHNKKQNSISLSIAEAECIYSNWKLLYTTLWMKQMLVDYGIVLDSFTVFCDNTSAINILKNLVQYSRTKHSGIRHHFIRDLVE